MNFERKRTTRHVICQKQRATVASSIGSMAFWRQNIAEQRAKGNTALAASYRDSFETSRNLAKIFRMHADMAGVVLP